MKKRILSLLMFILLAGSLAPLTGQAQPVSAANVMQPTFSNLLYLPAAFSNFNTIAYGAVTGVIIDAITGEKQGNTHVCVVNLHCVDSNADGEFYISGVPNAGPQTLTVVPNGIYYQDFSRQIQTSPGPPLYLVISLSPADLAPGWVRIVLTWATKGDLDANLWVGSSRIYWGDRGSCDVNACLQNDSNTFGPETITVRAGLTATISFGVARNGDMEVTQFGALVQVYDYTGLINSFIAPSSGYGSWWYVFDMTWDSPQNHYSLTTRNQILNVPPH
jgi:hypothetical protein